LIHLPMVHFDMPSYYTFPVNAVFQTDISQYYIRASSLIL